MAELSSEKEIGKEEKNVERGNSFKLFGRSPARSFSKKKSNPLTRMFGSRKKPEDVPNIADAESGSPSNSDDDSGKRGESNTVAPPIQKIAEEETIPQVVQPNIETFAQQTLSAKSPDAETKEFIPASNEKKPEFLGQLLEKAEKTKDELMEKGNHSLQEVFKTFTHSNTAPVERTIVDDKKPSQESGVNTIIGEVKGANIAERLLDEVVAVAGAVQERKEEALQQPKEETSQERKEETLQAPKEVSPQGENQENVEGEENCVTSLAQGLQKMCSTWNTKKED